MARRHSSHRAGHSGLGKYTHMVPGEHFLIVRPVRDDARRSVSETPRRAARRRATAHRKDRRKVGKKSNKLLMKDTHKGRASSKNPQSGRAPSSQKAPPTTFKGSITHGSHMRGLSGKTGVSKQTGVKVHRPRALRPHAPRLYHILPVQRLMEHL